MPFDTAFDLVDGGPENEIEAMAMHVVFGTLEGGKFDWDSGEWEKRE